MRATVLLFAGARARAGSPELTVELPEGSTVLGLKAALARACPALGPILPSTRIAIDAEYAGDDQLIPGGSELAAIPPVSGGSAP